MPPTTTSDHRKTKRSSDRRAGAERRTRAAGGPQDQAHYRCGCGHAFAGKVSTHVACPRCGSDQAW